MLVYRTAGSISHQRESRSPGQVAESSSKEQDIPDSSLRQPDTSTGQAGKWEDSVLGAACNHCKPSELSQLVLIEPAATVQNCAPPTGRGQGLRCDHPSPDWQILWIHQDQSKLFVAGPHICFKVYIFKATVEAVEEDEGHGPRLLVDHARLDVRASTPGKAVDLRKILDARQPGSHLRLLMDEYGPGEERPVNSLKNAPQKLAEAPQRFIVDACPLLGHGLLLARCLVAMSHTRMRATSASRIELATTGSQGPAVFVGEYSGGSPITNKLSAMMCVRRFPSAIRDKTLLNNKLPNWKNFNFVAHSQV